MDNPVVCYEMARLQAEKDKITYVEDEVLCYEIGIELRQELRDDWVRQGGYLSTNDYRSRRNTYQKIEISNLVKYKVRYTSKGDITKEQWIQQQIEKEKRHFANKNIGLKQYPLNWAALSSVWEKDQFDIPSETLRDSPVETNQDEGFVDQYGDHYKCEAAAKRMPSNYEFVEGYKYAALRFPSEFVHKRNLHGIANLLPSKDEDFL